MLDQLDNNALARRVFRPIRPRLAEVRAAIAGIDDPQEAWETLAARGILPANWCDNDARRFRAGPPVLEDPIGKVRSDHDAGDPVSVWLIDRDMRYRLSSRGQIFRDFRAAEPLRAGDFVVQCGRFDVRPADVAPWCAHPPTIDAVLGFAADIASATAAELLAREHFGDRPHAMHWRALCDEELDGLREDVVALAHSDALPRELRAALALGYFVRGIDRDESIELLCPERIEGDDSTRS